MDATSILLTIFHACCFVTAGILFGIQFVHLVEFESKRILKYSNLRAIMTVALMLFLAWIIAVTGGLEKHHWMVNSLLIISAVVSIYLTIKILFKKKGMSFFGKEIKQ